MTDHEQQLRNLLDWYRSVNVRPDCQHKETKAEAIRWALNRIRVLEDAIRSVVTQSADDLCWMDVYTTLGHLVGVKITREQLAQLPTDEFLENCRRFHLSLQTGCEYRAVD